MKKTIYILQILLLLSGVLNSQSLKPDGTQKIFLKNRTITPFKGVLSKQARKNSYVLIQFKRIPSLDALKKQSITPLNYVNPNTIFAYVPLDKDLTKITNITWYEALKPEDKIAKNIDLNKIEKSQVLIYLPKNISLEEKNNFYATMNISSRNIKGLPKNIILATVSKEKVLELAKNRFVSWIYSLGGNTISEESHIFCSGPITPYGSVAEFTDSNRYVLQGSRWTEVNGCYPLNYFIENTGQFSTLTPSQQKDVIVEQFQKWADVSKVYFNEAANPNESRTIVMSFINESAGFEHGDGDPFDGQGGTLAHAFFPQFGGAIHMDGGEFWIGANETQGTKLLITSLHELGHSLGLSHSDMNSAVMAPFYNAFLYDLQEDDILGIQQLYGQPSNSCSNQPMSYCSSNGQNTSFEYINRVKLEDINNTTGASAGGYGDYTSISTNLEKGTATTITITPSWVGNSYDEGYAVWIDYNQDGDFEDSNEQVFSKAPSQSSSVSGTFTVPSDAATGTTRMRVSMKYNGTPNPCGDLNYGEVEDYTVNIKSAVVLTYCNSNGNNTDDEYISKFTLTESATNHEFFSNSSGVGITSTGYSDFAASISPVNIKTTNTITVTPTWTGRSYREGYAVWIDYNQDGDFNDSGEQVFTKAPSQSSPVSGTFTIPLGAATGITRMRVSMKYNGIPAPCETFSYGEVEDYLVQIGNGVGVSLSSAQTNNSFNEISIYPNPVKSILHIKTVNTKFSYSVFNLKGQQIISNTSLINNSVSVNVDSLSSGMYIIKFIDSENNIIYKRMVKE